MMNIDTRPIEYGLKELARALRGYGMDKLRISKGHVARDMMHNKLAKTPEEAFEMSETLHGTDKK